MSRNTSKSKLIALVILGVCDALREESINVLDAERLVFSPHVMNSDAASDERIRRAIHMGTELDDIKDLVPQEYTSTLERIRCTALEYLRESYQTRVPEQQHWIDSLT